MKIKKQYHYKSGKQIWRLLPTETGKLIIEIRDTLTKEVFFSCIDIETGKTFLSDVQLEEKFWVGIETVYDDIIFFHKFHKPDMPGHSGITAFDINDGRIKWEISDYSFLFLHSGIVYCYRSKFEGRNFTTFDYKSGTLVEELGDDSEKINKLHERARSEENFKGYYFPDQYFHSDVEPVVSGFLEKIKNENVITGKIEFVHAFGLLFFNYHRVLDNGFLTNVFKAIDIESGKVIFEEKLNDNAKAFVPDSFFIKDMFLFLLKEKSDLIVCKLE